MCQFVILSSDIHSKEMKSQKLWLDANGISLADVPMSERVWIVEDTLRLRLFARDGEGLRILHHCGGFDCGHYAKHESQVPVVASPQEFGVTVGSDNV